MAEEERRVRERPSPTLADVRHSGQGGTGLLSPGSKPPM
jgi:hypothetical protein